MRKKLTAKELEEIRAALKAQETEENIITEGRREQWLVDRIPALLDHIEVMEGKAQRLRSSHDAWTDEIRQAVYELEMKYGIELVSIEHHAQCFDRCEAMEEEAGRLREALQEMTRGVVIKDNPTWWCRKCGTVLDIDKKGHADACPLKLLES